MQKYMIRQGVQISRANLVKILVIALKDGASLFGVFDYTFEYGVLVLETADGRYYRVRLDDILIALRKLCDILENAIIGDEFDISRFGHEEADLVLQVAACNQL